uniref:TM7S3/TM198-like domain-containing protein n=1 Tax=Dendroctonus ponderosae TaxID=77166 RepID=A0AAR5P9F3_DENPD
MQNILFRLGFLACFCSSAFSGVTYPPITIDLQNKPPGHQITEFRTLTILIDTRIDVININAGVGFFLIQVHSYMGNITLSDDSDAQISGTNIGLIWKGNSENVAHFYLFRDHLALLDNITMLIAVSTYSKYDPVPGGCNLSFETEIAPYQKISESDDFITVISQPPSQFGNFCNRSNIVTRMYYLYLSEHDNSTEQYFANIQKMISVDDIVKYGTLVLEGLTANRFKQMYSRYAGTGRVFAAVSTRLGRSAAYVPAVSYGCDVAAWDADCSGPVGTQWKIVTAFLLLCGLFICFSGHKFFKTGLFIIAYIFGAVFMLTAISILTQFGGQGKDIFSFISGLAFALLWLFLWRKFGIPVVAVQLAFLLNGLLVASILFYSQLGDIYIFANDATFWTCFVCLLIVTQKPFGCLTSLFYIIALSLVGSYAVIFAVNYYVGGNLPYILLNTYRRITVANFGSAVIAPPYQTMDICQTGLWVLIFCIGVYVQTRSSMGRPPFPPRRADRARARVDENTPLIEPSQEMPPAYFEAVYS